MHFNEILSSVHNLVASLEQKKKDFLKSPETDFSRKRKISFSDCISLCLLMGSKTVYGELLDYYAKKGGVPTQSAMIQQRSKIKVRAFEELFSMSSSLGRENLYNGYHLLAVDGSDLHIPTNPDDASTFFPGANGQSPYNMMHLNAMYDILGNMYLDAELQDRMQENEPAAAIDMVERSAISSAIVTADRGYESYNFMAHILEKGWEFLIRVKDIGGNGIVSRLKLPDSEEFDISINLNITRKQSKETRRLSKEYPNEYRYAPPNSSFDYLEPTKYSEPAVFYSLPFRAVRFRLSDDTFEVILTSLPREQYPAEEIKRLYGMRWGIETSFRTLKYNTGLLYFHSKKKEFVVQEIYAGLALFNIVAAFADAVDITHHEGQYEFSINLSHATSICKKLLLGDIPPDIAKSLLSSSVVPIRKGRCFARKGVGKRTAINLIYRIA